MKKKNIKIENESEDLSFSFVNIFFNGIFLLLIIFGIGLIFFMLFQLFKNFSKEIILTIIVTGIIFIFVLLLGILRISFLRMKEAIDK